MAISRKLKTYLDKNKIKYSTLKHKEAFTAQEIAAAQHIPGKQVVKSVLIKADDKYVLAVLPAIHMVDFSSLKKALNAKKVSLATENEINKVIPDFEIGAMPPFGSMFDLPVYADSTLKEDKEIVFNAGTHKDMVKMKYKDFEKLAKPALGEFGKHI
jgi:Ala-tRNA(Pro) deacylase